MAFDRASSWRQRRTLYPQATDREAVLRTKRERGLSIAVCLPARDEEETVGAICEAIARELVEPGLVDRLIVMDSRSTDGTAEVAGRAGAEVHAVTEVLPHLPGLDGGKGEALWKSLAVAREDVVVWMDSDTRNFTPEFALRLVQPLLTDPELVLAKGFYERPIEREGRLLASGGARVTELVARPLLNLFYPELAGVLQPLSGEYAVRAEVARKLPFLSGYAPDIGLLLFVAEMHGLDAIVQVDLGMRVHRNRPISSLGRMSFQVMQGMLIAFNEFGRLKLGDELPATMTQFGAAAGSFEPELYELGIVTLPPMEMVAP